MKTLVLRGLLFPVLMWSIGCGGGVIDPSGAAPSSATGGTSGTAASGSAGPPGAGVGSGTGGASPAAEAGKNGAPGAPGAGVGPASGSGGGAQSGGPASGASGGSSGTGGTSSGSGGSGPGTGAGGRPAPGGPGVTGVTGVAGAAGTGAGPAGSGMGLPCDVQTLLVNRCQTCHGSTPAAGAPSTLVTYQNLTAPSKSDPTRSEAEVAVARMQNTTLPMPPKPGTPATAAEVSTLQAWIAAGYPMGSCGGGAAGGGQIVGADGGVADGGAGTTGGGAGPAPGGDVFAAAPICTSKAMTRGGEGPTMDPGMACISCHSRGEGPRFAIAGTVYPTAHEPDTCNGASGSAGIEVVITGADGKSLTLTPNAVGNFSSSGQIATPYQAKLVYMGRERLMVAAQTSGDCNSCHSQSGANAAPGRLVLP